MKKIIFLIISLLIFSIFFYLVKGERENRLEIHLRGESFIEGLKIFHKVNGVQDWILTAKRADIVNNGEMANLSDIVMTIENKNVTVYADKGLYNLDSKDLIINGKVTARSNDYSITTDNIALTNQADNLQTGSDVLIEGKKFTLYGNGMNFSSTDRKMRILKDVKAVFYK